ncbi:hypothetical protein TIFTF001_011305 [Ficus carica]|uniref:Uncharacterized protein n=1 Tax=Ficus carica TaxID=3494 RepID=A0AA88AA79_FICCA|nr:hypothetical protein TIFTF001_011305 [Ficus carica]
MGLLLPAHPRELIREPREPPHRRCCPSSSKLLSSSSLPICVATVPSPLATIPSSEPVRPPPTDYDFSPTAATIPSGEPKVKFVCCLLPLSSFVLQRFPAPRQPTPPVTPVCPPPTDYDFSPTAGNHPLRFPSALKLDYRISMEELFAPEMIWRMESIYGKEAVW